MDRPVSLDGRAWRDISIRRTYLVLSIIRAGNVFQNMVTGTTIGEADSLGLTGDTSRVFTGDLSLVLDGLGGVRVSSSNSAKLIFRSELSRSASSSSRETLLIWLCWVFDWVVSVVSACTAHRWQACLARLARVGAENVSNGLEHCKHTAQYRYRFGLSIKQDTLMKRK